MDNNIQNKFIMNILNVDDKDITVDRDEIKQMKQIQEHLYATTLFIGSNDSIDNYIEVVETIAEN